MCSFCNNLISKLGLKKYIDFNDFYIEKNINKIVRYNDAIKYTTDTNGGRLIPLYVICEARKQFMQNGTNSINTEWFERTFNRPFYSVPYSLKILREIIQ